MPKVKDYMTTPVVTITKDHTIQEAVNVMNQHDTNGLIVVGDDNQSHKIFGVLSSYDILKYLIPDYLEEDKHLASFEPSELFIKRATDIKNHKVSECMTVKRVHTVTPDDSLIEAAALLTEYRIHRLPVVDEKNNLIGYLSKSDVKRALGKIFNTLES